MSVVETITPIEYPESDGRPLGETDIHINWMIRVLQLLQHRYVGMRVYIACDLLVYYEEGNPSRFVVPDNFIVLDCEPGERRVYKIWEEGKSPNVAFEITSKSTRKEDTSHKPDLYARIGVRELFLYDPTSEYMATPLQGFRLQGKKYQPIVADSAGVLECQELGIGLHLIDGQLVMHDIQTGDVLRTGQEAAIEMANEAAKQRAAAEAVAAEAAKQRAAAEVVASEAAKQRDAAEARAESESQARRAAEDELASLRKELERRNRKE